MARPIAGATISFGLVSIPVKLYSATQPSAGVSFNLLHGKCGTRVKQQYICPRDNELVSRDEMVKGYEVSKDQYVTFTPEELKALEERATETIDIAQFVPVSSIDPVYFDKPYYLSADEVRPLGEVPLPDVEVREPELKLARQLIDQIAAETFEPTLYHDDVRERIQADIQRKQEGQDIATSAPEPQPARIIDLMEALKASLAAAPAASSPASAEADGEDRKGARRGAAPASKTESKRARAGKR